jgi:hypothetical protein
MKIKSNRKIRQRNDFCPPALGKIRENRTPQSIEYPGKLVAPDSPGGLHGGIAVDANKTELNKSRTLAVVHRRLGL